MCITPVVTTQVFGRKNRQELRPLEDLRRSLDALSKGESRGHRSSDGQREALCPLLLELSA